MLMDALRIFFESHQAIFAWTALASGGLVLCSLVIVPFIVIQIPADFFVNNNNESTPGTPLRICLMACRNLAGLFFCIAGLAMILLPGPGLLTMLLGIGLMDFPAKRKAQAHVVQLKGVRQSVDWLRRKAHREPLEFPAS